MIEKEQVTVFISYAREDQPYAEVFIREFDKHSNLMENGDIKWKTGAANDLRSAASCDFAILLVSPAFLKSQNSRQPELTNLLKEFREKKFPVFPVLLEDCDYASLQELTGVQFFLPKGIDYGKPWLQYLSYSELVKFNPADKSALPDPNRKRYMAALGKSLNSTLQLHKPKPKHKRDKEIDKNKYFKLVKTTKYLLPEDILGPGRRAAVNRNLYWRRKPDDILDMHLANGRSVLILGNALAGKTRALYEGLKKLTDTTVLIPHDRFSIEDDFAVPDTGTKNNIAFFDDIDEILSHNSVEHLDNLLLRLMEQGITIAATCRRGNEYRAFDGMVAPQVREHFERIFINRLTENQVNGFKTFFNKKKGEKEALDEKAFDGNIGSYFMNFTVMRERYRDLEKLIMDYPMNIPEKLPREILKALKYFYYTENTEGKSLFLAAKIKDFCERALLGKRPKPKRNEKAKKAEGNNWQQKLDLFASPMIKEEYTQEEWEAALSVLSEADYDLDFIQPEPPYIRVEEAYLERVVARGLPLDRIVGILNTFYRGEDLQRQGFLTSVFGFNKLISLARTSDEAYRIFSRLKTPGIHPTVVTFTSLINKADSYKSALSFLDKMKEYNVTPDQIVFHALFLKAGFKDAAGLLEKMKGYNVTPNEHIFTALINKATSTKDALSLLDKMKEYNIPPDQIIFTSLVNKADTFKDALVFFDNMTAGGVKPDEGSFNSLINKADSFQAAISLLDKMKEQEIYPNESTFNFIIDKAESFKDVLFILDKIQELQIKLNINIFTELLGKAGTFKEAMELLSRIKTLHIQPNKAFITQLTQMVHRNPDEAMTILFECCEPGDIFSNYLFNRIISEVCRSKASHLEKILPHLETIGLQKDPIIIFYARLMEYNDKADIALKLLENVKSKNFDYYNIKANCLKKTDMKSSLEHYKLAVENTEDRKHKAIALNNMAQLVFDHGQKDLYAEAGNYCKQALALEPFRFFPYPGHLLLLFTIHDSPIKDLKKKVEHILKTYKIPRQTLGEIADKIEDEEKRKFLAGKK